MNNLFKFFTTNKAPVYFPGAAFLLGAVFMIGSALVAWLTLRSEKHVLST